MATRVLGLASGLTTAEGHRLGLNGFTMASSPLNGRSGVYPTIGAAALATVSAMVCSIAPFNAWIDGGNTSTQAGYPLCLDATVNITFDAGNASTVRYDRIIAIVRDNPYDGSGVTAGSVEYLKGNTTTGAATAVPTNALLLYEVAVQAGVNAGNGGINFSTYATKKFTWTVGAGGVLPVDTQAERDAIVNPWSGCTVFRTDLKTHETFDGSIWRTLGMPVVSSVANLSTISNPFTGQIAVVSALVANYMYNGASWVFLSAPPMWARRTSDWTAVNNSTTLQSDAVLTIPVAANTTTKFDLHLIYDAHGTADAKVGWSVPAGSSGEWAPWGPAAGISSYEASTNWQSTGALSNTQTFGAIGTGVLQAVRISGCIVTAGTAGSLTMQIAQGTAHASDLKVRSGSTLYGIRTA